MSNSDAHKAFQATLTETGRVFGYTPMGVFPLRTQHGWRTPTTLKGWPDLVLIRPPRMLAIEVKTGGGRLEEEQRAVLTLLSQIPCFRTAVIHPDSPAWREVVEWLRRPAPAPQVLGYRPMEEDPGVFLEKASPKDRRRTTSLVPWPKWSP